MDDYSLTDQSSFTIQLLSTERKEPVLVNIAFTQPPKYPDEPLIVKVELLDGLPAPYRTRLEQELRTQAQELVGSTSAFPLCEAAKAWIEKAVIEEGISSDKTFFDELDKVRQQEEQEVSEARDYVPYTCWTAEDITQKQRKKCGRVAALLQVSPSVAQILLKFFEWNSDKLLDKYLVNPTEVLTQAGVLNPQLAHAVAPKSSSCLICDEGPTAVKIEKYLDCKHPVCSDCWAQYMVVKVNSGDIKSIRCPAYRCAVVVPDELITRLLDSDLMAKYQKWSLKAFIERAPNIRWCTRRDCTTVIKSMSDEPSVVRCVCGTSFCFGCGEEAHYPALCSMVKTWRGKYAVEEQERRVQDWIRANTKPCVKCKSQIEKNGGCNHMTCKKCSWEFCWICGAPWQSSHYSCNRVSQKPGTDSAEELTRFNRYSDAFTAHDVSVRLEGQIRERARRKAREMMLASDRGTWQEALTVQNAAEQLLRCRQVLKWSFVLGYFRPPAMNLRLFEYLQSELDVAADTLSTQVEHVTLSSRVALLNAMALAEHKLISFLLFGEQELKTKFYIRALLTSEHDTTPAAEPEKRPVDLRFSSGAVPAANTKLLLRQSTSSAFQAGKRPGERQLYRLFAYEKGSPVLMPGRLGDLKVVKVAACPTHALVLTDRRQLFAWGQGRDGQLGLGDFEAREQPEPVRFFEEEEDPVWDITCAEHVSYAIGASGDAYGWGYNSHMQLGLGGTGYRIATPQHISVRLADKTIVQIAANGRVALFLTKNGTVYGCGDSTFANSGSINWLEYPSRYAFLGDEVVVKKVALTEKVAYALAVNGVLWYWGGTSRAPQAVEDRARKYRDIFAAGHAFAVEERSDEGIRTVWIRSDNSSATEGFLPCQLPEPTRSISPVPLPSSVYLFTRSDRLLSIDSASLYTRRAPPMEELPLEGLRPAMVAAGASSVMLLVLEDDEPTLRSGLRRALHSGHCCDITFLVQGREVPVNRALLFMRCEGFAKQALSGASPGSHVVTLGSKIDAEAFKTFLEFLYTDDIEELSPASMRQLLQLAKQYNLPRLIAVCRGSHVPSQLVADVHQAYKAGKWFDVELECEDTVYQAHKVVLAARSPFFAGLFNSHRVDEKRVSNAFTSAASMDFIVEWCYTDSTAALVGAPFELLCQVLADAHYLMIRELHAIVADRIARALSAQTLLLLAPVVAFCNRAIINKAESYYTSGGEWYKLVDNLTTQKQEELRTLISAIRARIADLDPK